MFMPDFCPVEVRVSFLCLFVELLFFISLRNRRFMDG